jgi:alpha-tubulin suppressor-like RCC1 family protein
MQQITVNKCECPFEVATIIDLKDLVAGQVYKYKLSLMNTGSAVFNPPEGEVLADSISESLHIIMHLKDNPNNYYLVNLELFDPFYKSIRREIICIKNLGKPDCAAVQCTPTPTPTPSRFPSNIDKHLNIANYKIHYDDKDQKLFGAYRNYITVRDWVEFLNSVAQYDDINKLWKPIMQEDILCGIRRTYDGFFYVYTIDGCDVDEFGCYANDSEHANRAISYVSWSDLARYVNWVHNDKPKGRQGPETTEDGSYPLYGNRYPAPGIPYHPGARFWLDTTTIIQQCPVTATPTHTPTPSVTIGLTPTATPTTTATRTPTPSVTPPPPSQTGTPAQTPTQTTTTTLTRTPTTTTTRTATPTQTPSNLAVGLTITQQPQQDIFTAIGIDRTISVSVVAVPSNVVILYQWQRSIDGGQTWNNIAGATASSYTIGNIQLSNSGDQYRVIVSGSSPSGLNNPTPVTSDISVLSVIQSQILITEQPQNVSTVLTIASFSVAADIDPDFCVLSYQWQVSTNGGINFTNISGATSSTLNLTNLDTSFSGRVYRVNVSGTGGANTITSSTATLVVTAPEILITTQPVNTTSSNASVSFSVNASIPDTNDAYTLSYIWQRSTDNGVSFQNISGATSSTYSINNVTQILNGYMYRVIVSSNIGSSPVTSNSATLIVNDDYGALLVWGNNGSNQLNFSGSTSQPRFTNLNTTIYRSVALGQNHALFIDASGTSTGYGVNSLNQLAGSNKSNVINIATKYNHNLAIIRETTGSSTIDKLYSWGQNSFGQCGVGTIASSIGFTAIPNDSNSYIDVATGENHSLALRSNNTMVACGRNDFGQLGTGGTSNTTSFVSISGNISSIACGQSHSAAITTNGVLYTWGNNNFGQLGTTPELVSTSNNPMAVSGVSWVKVVCGQGFTAALNNNNEVYTWGNNEFGQLGRDTSGSTGSSYYPIRISGLWRDISAGYFHMIGIQTDGTLWAWGSNVQRQIGDGSSINKPTPTKIGESPDYQWSRVFAGGNSSSATRFGSIITITQEPSGIESTDASASFNIEANITGGSVLSYQWQIRINNGASFDNVTNATSNMLNLSSLNNSNNNDIYRCIVSGTEGAYPIVSRGAGLTMFKNTVWYRGNAAIDGATPNSTSTTWTEWNFTGDSWRYNSSAVRRAGNSNITFTKNTTTSLKQVVRAGPYTTAFLNSDGRVWITTNVSDLFDYIGSSLNTVLENPSGETIVKLIGNYGLYSYSSTFGRAFLWAISNSGKLYAAGYPNTSNSNAWQNSVANQWNRIGSSLIVSDAAATCFDGTYYPTVFAISASDQTLFAWGDNRLIDGQSASRTQSPSVQPVRVSNDSWTSVAGNMGGFYGIKSDGAVYRIVGRWTGGTVSGSNGSATTTLLSGTVTPINGTINPVLIDNSVAYTKLAASNSILIGYDVNNKLHINPNFNIARELPNGWNSISEILLGINTSTQGAVILTNDYDIQNNQNNIAMMRAINGTTYYEYGASSTTTARNTTSSWGTGASIPQNDGQIVLKAKFKNVIPDFPGYWLAIKDD